MTTPELLKAFLQLPEIRTVGSAEERAAFTAIYIDGRTVREAAEIVGVSKSQVSNLTAAFQTKLGSQVRRLRKPTSNEYRELCLALHGQLGKLQEESGSRDDDDYIDYKMSHEDYAEATGTALRDPDEWN